MKTNAMAKATAEVFGKAVRGTVVCVPGDDSLTPADRGILSAAHDDALAAGLGDDDTLDQMVSALVHGAGVPATTARKSAVAYLRSNKWK